MLLNAVSFVLNSVKVYDNIRFQKFVIYSRNLFSSTCNLFSSLRSHSTPCNSIINMSLDIVSKLIFHLVDDMRFIKVLWVVNIRVSFLFF